MSKVFVGGISQEGNRILHTYLSKFMPDAEIEEMKASAIKGRMRNHAKRAEVALVIIDEDLFQSCVGIADDTLSLPKVHKYINDSGLNDFLISKFGIIDESIISSESSTADTSSSSSSSYLNYTKVQDSEDSVDLLIQEDTSSEDITSNLEEELRGIIATKDGIIENLREQIVELSGDSTDLSEYLKKISDLESKLEEKELEITKVQENSFVDLGKVAHAEQIIGDLNTARADLVKAKDDINNLIQEKDTLIQNINSLSEEISGLKKDNEDLRGIKLSYEELESKYKSTLDSLEDCNTRIEEYIGIKDNLSEQITNLNKTIDSLQIQLADKGILENRLEELTTKLSEANSTILTLNGSVKDYDEVNLKLSNAISDLESEVADKLVLQEKITSLEKTLASTTEDLSTLKTQYNHAQDELNSKINELTDKTNKVSELQSQLDSSSNSSSEKLSAYESELTGLRNSVTGMRTSISEKEVLISELNASIVKLTSDISSKDKEIISLERNISELRLSISSKDSDIAGKQVEISSLSLRISKLESELSLAKEKDFDKVSKDNEENKQKIADLEADLVEHKRLLVKATSESDVLKKDLENASNTSDKDNEIKELRGKISLLNDSVSTIRKEFDKKEQGYKSEISKLDSDLSYAKNLLKNKELDIVEKDTSLKDIQNNIFFQLTDYSSPKSAFNLTVDMPIMSISDMSVFSSGNYVTTPLLYSFLHKQMQLHSDKNYLILDLVAESGIDIPFGLKSADTPLEWLKGNEPIENFMLETNLPNVKVATTGLRYLNELYLLNVKWVDRLKELSDLPYNIIINVGCLNSVVRNILYSSFSSVCRGYILTISSPLGIRSTLRNLTGQNSIRNTTILCIKYIDDSRTFYESLAKKYIARIMQDEDKIDI